MDYAKLEKREAWLRHPVLGDPSFDAFEKVGETVHVSQAPYEWAVNGSIFRDPKTGFWYYYAGLYPYGYVSPPGKPELLSHFIIYRSMDKGESWECLGPNQHTSVSVAAEEAFSSSLSVELEERGGYRVLARGQRGERKELAGGRLPGAPKALEALLHRGKLSVRAGGELIWEGEAPDCAMPLAVCAHEFSVLSCSRFEVEGIPGRYTLRYNAEDALLAAMQHISWQPSKEAGFLCGRGYIGSGEQCAKWNIRGEGFRIFAPKTPELGYMEVWVDGFLYGTTDLYAEEPEPSGKVYEVQGLPGESRHLVMLKGYEGQRFAVDMIEVDGDPV